MTFHLFTPRPFVKKLSYAFLQHKPHPWTRAGWTLYSLQTKLSQFSALMNSFNVHQFTNALSPFNDRAQALFPLNADETINCTECSRHGLRKLKPICNALLNVCLSHVNALITVCTLVFTKITWTRQKNLRRVNKCSAGSTLDRNKIVQHTKVNAGVRYLLFVCRFWCND